jgi:competence protein ComEC
MINPHAYDQNIWDEGIRVKITGEIYQKEYISSDETDETLILSVKNSDTGSVMCYIEADENMEEPKLGSVVALEGKVSYFKEARNPGGFDARSYYKILGIECRLYNCVILAKGNKYSVYHETLYKVRRYLEGVYDKVLNEKDASIMKAMVLGNRSGLDSDSKQLFQKSGIAHVFAISGLHITLLGMGLYRLLRKLCIPHALCCIIPVAVMIAYGDMVGMSSSAYRAVVMFGLQLGARLLRRTYDMLTSLAVAAVLILAEQPLYLYNSGFLLSFGAILGIGCMSEVLALPKCHGKKKSARKAISERIISALLGSLSIFLIHFPIMLVVYYEFPVYSFLLNLIIIPMMTLVMMAGVACLLIGAVPAGFCLGAAKLTGLLCHFMLSLFEWLCTVSLKLPCSDWIVGRPKYWRVAVFLLAVAALYILHSYAVKISKGRACEHQGINIGISLNIKLITVLVAVAFVSQKQILNTSLNFLDVGQGDCIFIESESGGHFLIDAGSSSQSSVAEYTLEPYLKYMGVSKLDAVFLTHLDTDHISGVLEILENGKDTGNSIAIKRICISDSVIEDEAYDTLMQLCEKNNIAVYRLKTGDILKAGEVSFEVLHPDKDYTASSRNAYSLVMKLTVDDEKTGRKVTALLTGDVEADGEEKIAHVIDASKESGKIDIYKAAHHGSKYSNTKELVDMASPSLTVISCAENNSYGHPHKEALENFENAGSDILVTKDTGAIMIDIKDGEYKVKKYLQRNYSVP